MPVYYKHLKINGKFIDEHRYVMEQYLGRKLKRSEEVHHKNKNVRDNRIENLEVVEFKKHQRYHGLENSKNGRILLICENCGVIFERILSQCKPNIKNNRSFYCSRPCIKSCQINKEPSRKKYKMTRTELIELIKNEISNGLSGYMIGKKYNLNNKTVYNNIKKLR